MVIRLGEIYKTEELVTLAKREKNSIRPYLYVNPVQGKHIPTEPEKSLKLFRYMAKLLDEQYAGECVLLIGFAETATAIGAAISEYAECVRYCTHTTREKYEDAEYLFFTESHSHATEQSLIINGYDEIWNGVDRVVFAEDEVTTGNTICKLISALKMRFEIEHIKFGIISILNSMSEYRMKELLCQEIVCQYVKKIPFEYRKEDIDKYHYSKEDDDNLTKQAEYLNEIAVCANLRKIQKKECYLEAVKGYVGNLVRKIEIKSTDIKILILGTEEFMYPPLMLADTLKKLYPGKLIKFHATTRSPIMVSEDAEYPLHNRRQIRSTYDSGRITYLYNLTDYDLAIVLTDSDNVKEDSYKSIMEALAQAGCKRIYFAYQRMI